MKVKICGMREEQNVIDILALKPDFVGFIFYPPSGRYVGENFDTKITDLVPKDCKKVGVFVNLPVADLMAIKILHKFDFVQLHGNESWEYCKELSWLDTKIIKAFSIDEEFDWNDVKNYERYCAYFIFDTKTIGFGGSGTKFDWEILKKYTGKVPFLLSGGVGLDDLDKIAKIKHQMLVGLDVNSRFETEPGVKDVQKLKKFIQQIKH